MQKPFSTQPELFVTSADLEHPSLQGLDGAEAVLDWAKLEHLLLTNVNLGLAGADLTNFQLYNDKANSIVGTQLDDIFDG